MRRVLSISTIFIGLSLWVMTLDAPPASAQVYGVSNPSSRTAGQSGASVTLSGWVLASGQTVSIDAIDQSTGTRRHLGDIPANTSGTIYHAVRCPGNHPPCMKVTYTLYPWSYSTSPLANNYWAPQLNFAAGVSNSQGHLEIFASAGGASLPTFSPEALNAMQKSPLYHIDPEMAAMEFSDGTSTVLFDQYGVGGGPASWTTAAGLSPCMP